MQEELDTLHANNTWSVVPLPNNDRNVVGSKWVFKIKRDANGNIARYKARLVAQGFSQQPGTDFDEIFAPVVRYDSLRLLLALASHHRWRPQQLDIKGAFLYGILKEEIYMQLPEGSRQNSMCAKLNRCIYGLKQSPREWYHRLSSVLVPYGFTVSTFDPCVLIHKLMQFFLAVYVDDITLWGSTGNLMTSTKQLLKKEFEVTDMGDLHWLLGMKIEYLEDGIAVSQTAYIHKILQRFGLGQCNPVLLPLDANHAICHGSEEEILDIKLYQKMIGSLMYTVTGTRPDLAFTITFLSQYLTRPTQEHYEAVKHVFRYLQGTKKDKLFFPYGKSLVLEGFTDSNFAACRDTRRSTSGYIFKLGGATISWRSRKQRSVATSTLEAEYMACTQAAKQHIWLKRALTELGYHNIPSALSCDNMGSIDLSENPRIGDRSKHIDIAYHFIRELVEIGALTILHIPSKLNPADLCTKALPGPQHEFLKGLIMG
jgi:hypothetical protein